MSPELAGGFFALSHLGSLRRDLGVAKGGANKFAEAPRGFRRLQVWSPEDNLAFISYLVLCSVTQKRYFSSGRLTIQWTSSDIQTTKYNFISNRVSSVTQVQTKNNGSPERRTMSLGCKQLVSFRKKIPISGYLEM